MSNRTLTGSEFNSKPDRYRHDSVMDDMESGNVIVLLPQHEKNCIRKLGKLREIVPPTTPRHAHCCWTVRVIDRLTLKRILSSPAGLQSLWKRRKRIRISFLDEYFFHI